jgi:hypothetical protein
MTLPGIAGGMLVGSNPTYPTLYLAISALALTSNLKLCLDAGDANSYVSGQSWLDVSGNGYDFFRGITSGSETQDPTFNGLPGGQSVGEYWSFDGGDRFTYDTTLETWMNALHKDAAVFSFVFWIYVKDPGANLASLFGTFRISVGTGVVAYYSVTSPTRLTLSVENAGATVYTLTPAVDLVKDAWNFVSVSINETANTHAVNINGTAASGTATYSSPAAGDSANVMNIGSNNGSNNMLPSGSRLASTAMWQGTALSAANLASLFTATRGKFGI